MKENIVLMKPEVVEEETIQEEQKISNVLQGLLHKLRTIFRI